jgi:hypothetical protein
MRPSGLVAVAGDTRRLVEERPATVAAALGQS